MSNDRRFRGTYLAIVALCWEALERVDALLCGVTDERAIEGRLQLLRLELLQLGDRADRCAGSRDLTDSEHRQVRRLAAAVLGWLEFDAGVPVDVRRLRIQSAQNWLFDEAGRPDSHCDSPLPGGSALRQGP